MKKLLITFLLLFSLSGCATLENKTPPLIPEASTLNISSEALSPCSLLPHDVQINVFSDAVEAYGSLASMYGICAGKQATSIKLIKKLGNIVE